MSSSSAPECDISFKISIQLNMSSCSSVNPSFSEEIRKFILAWANEAKHPTAICKEPLGALNWLTHNLGLITFTCVSVSQDYGSCNGRGLSIVPHGAHCCNVLGSWKYLGLEHFKLITDLFLNHNLFYESPALHFHNHGPTSPIHCLPPRQF